MSEKVVTRGQYKGGYEVLLGSDDEGTMRTITRPFKVIRRLSGARYVVEDPASMPGREGAMNDRSQREAGA